MVYLPLQGNSAAGFDFSVPDGNGDADLSGHGSTADDRLAKLELLDHLCDASDIRIFSICVRARDVVFWGKASAVTRQVEGIHGAALAHTLVIHDAMILPAVRACSVEEDDLPLPDAGLLDKDLGAAPMGSGHVDVAAGDEVVVCLGRLGVGGHWAGMGVVENLENAAPDVRVMYKCILVTLDFDALLLDVHTVHA